MLRATTCLERRQRTQEAMEPIGALDRKAVVSALSVGSKITFKPFGCGLCLLRGYLNFLILFSITFCDYNQCP